MARHQTAARIAKGQGLAVRTPKPAPSAPVTVIPGRRWVAGYCAICSRSFVSMYWDKTCSNECQAMLLRNLRLMAKSRRRARQHAAYVSDVSPSLIYLRDGYMCKLCHEPLDMTAAVPELHAPTIDHIIALANGGTHEPSNAQAAHFVCNSRKGHRLPASS